MSINVINKSFCKQILHVLGIVTIINVNIVYLKVYCIARKATFT